jgi:hypothetical protein
MTAPAATRTHGFRHHIDTLIRTTVFHCPVPGPEVRPRVGARLAGFRS